MTVLQAPIETRDKILAEAERLFRHYGYGKTTMADIAEACRMSPANLYRFFASKSALVEAICGQVCSEAEGRLLQIARADKSASRRLERLIQEVHHHTLENLLDHRKVHEMVVVAMEEQWHVIKAHLDRVCSYIEMIIKDGIASGEFKPQDSARAAKCVHSSMAFLCHPALVAQKLDDEQRTTPEEMARYAVASLKANP